MSFSIVLSILVILVVSTPLISAQQATSPSTVSLATSNLDFFSSIVQFFKNLFAPSSSQNLIQTYKVNTDCELAGVMLSLPNDFLYSSTIQKKYPDEWGKLVKLGQDPRFQYQMKQAEENIGKNLSNSGVSHVALPDSIMEIEFSIMSKEYSVNPTLKDDFLIMSQGFAPHGFDSNKCEYDLYHKTIPKYALSVEPRIEMVMGSGDFLRVYVQNIGTAPLTNLKINYGKTFDSIPILNQNEKKMFTPPAGTTMVVVTDDQGITVTKPVLNR